MKLLGSKPLVIISASIVFMGFLVIAGGAISETRERAQVSRSDSTAAGSPQLTSPEKALTPPRSIGNDIPIHWLEIGDCIRETDALEKMVPITSRYSEVRLEECSKPGVVKVFAITTWQEHVSYRGRDYMAEHLRFLCKWQMEEYFGFPEDVFTEVKYGYSWDSDLPIWLGAQPSIEGWSNGGTNSVFCLAWEENFDLIQTPDPSTYEGIQYRRELENSK